MTGSDYFVEGDVVCVKWLHPAHEKRSGKPKLGDYGVVAGFQIGLDGIKDSSVQFRVSAKITDICRLHPETLEIIGDPVCFDA